MSMCTEFSSIFELEGLVRFMMIFHLFLEPLVSTLYDSHSLMVMNLTHLAITDTSGFATTKL